MIAILDERSPTPAIRSLERLGYEPILLPPSRSLPAPIASHPDALLFFAPDAILCEKSYLSLAKELLFRISQAAGKPLRSVDASLGADYPSDVLFNACPLGKHLFCHPSATAKEIRTHSAYSAIPVRQGYVKCSTLPVGKNALISADPSILAAARAHGIDALQISAGSIVLDGYDYGFIGGCASLTPYADTDTVYLCGDPDTHPDGAEIQEFCRLHGVTLHALCDGPLTDVGTIFLI